jgi:exodeoxyribonuclease-3
LNGIRAVRKKNELQNLFENFPAEIYLFQETKIDALAAREFEIFHPNFRQFFCAAQKKGYAGTAIFVEKKFADSQKIKFSGENEIGISGKNSPQNEGRIARVEFENWEIFSVYFPNGGKSPEAWRGKLEFYEKFLTEISARREAGKKVIFGGDINCAPKPIDLARPAANDGKIGFHPAERAAILNFKNENWVDVFREKFPTEKVYSWWDVKSRARERNVGWRIDAFWISRENYDAVKKVKYLNSQFGSDHCPVFLEI